MKIIATHIHAIKAGLKFEKEVNRIHNNFFNYDKFVYLNAKTKSIIGCPLHGDYLQNPNKHLRGRGCPKCGGTLKSNKEEFVKKANMVHDSYYDYSKSIYEGNHIKLIIICPIHGDYLQEPNSHLNGCGCPKCNRRESYREKIIHHYLYKLKLKVESCKKIDGVELDIYIPYLKLGIEYDGEYYHRDKAKKDLSKNLFFKERGIDIIRIREKGLPNIKECFNISRTSNSETELEFIIHSIIEYINQKYNKKYKVDVDIKRDKIALLNDSRKNKIKNSFGSTFPEIAKSWHPIKNGDLKPENFSKGSSMKVWWLCENKHEWQTRIAHRSNGVGCPYCSGLKITAKNSIGALYEKDILEKFWDYKKNVITPFEVGIYSEKKVYGFALNGTPRFTTVANIVNSIISYLNKNSF